MSHHNLVFHLQHYTILSCQSVVNQCCSNFQRGRQGGNLALPPHTPIIWKVLFMNPYLLLVLLYLWLFTSMILALKLTLHIRQYSRRISHVMIKVLCVVSRKNSITCAYKWKNKLMMLLLYKWLIFEFYHFFKLSAILYIHT